MFRHKASLQVNVGPLAYAEAFTTPTQKILYGPSGTEKLADAFRYCKAFWECQIIKNLREGDIYYNLV